MICRIRCQLLLSAGLKANFFSRKAFCAPVMPGRTLYRADVAQLFQAPWWVPAPYKTAVFNSMCATESAMSPLTLHWLPAGPDQRLTVTRGPSTVLRKSSLEKLEIYGDTLRVWNKKGFAEDHRSLW